MIKIDVERSGFPVAVGDVELWFDSSIENLKNFMNIDEVAKKRLDEISEGARHVHFPEEITLENVSEIDGEDIEKVFSMNKEFIAIQYDIMFGEGAFKKLYEVYEDVHALERVLIPVGEAVAERIEEELDVRESEYEEQRTRLLEKQKQKKGQK